MLCLLALLVLTRCCDYVQKPQSLIDSSQEQTTIIGLHLTLGPWPLSAATSLDTAALQQGQACPAGAQADLAFSVMSGSAAASATRPDSATGLATSFVGRLNSDADTDSHQAAGAASQAASHAAPSAAAASSLATFASSFNRAAATEALPDSAPRGLSAYTEPFCQALLQAFPKGVDPAVVAAVSEQHFAKHAQNIAGLPKLHASALEVLRLSGLLTATQTDSHWKANGLEIYECCVRWFADFATAWLVEFAGGKSKPDRYDLPPFEAHIRMICE